MRCSKCSKMGALYRNAPKGEPCKDWRCLACLDPAFAKVPLAVLRVTQAIVGANATRDDFHAHLDTCSRCRNEPFNLCAVGSTLLEAAGRASVQFITTA